MEFVIDVGRQRLEVCAYSGCWTGKGSVLRNTRAFLIADGYGLTTPRSRERADVAVVVNKRTSSAVLTVLGFNNPMSCVPG